MFFGFLRILPKQTTWSQALPLHFSSSLFLVFEVGQHTVHVSLPASVQVL